MATISDLQLPGQTSFRIVLAALAVAAIGYVVKCLTSPLAKIPGPWYTKFTDIVATIHLLQSSRPAYVHELHEKYGPVVRLSPTEVDLMDVPAVKEIHAVKATYVKSPFYKEVSGPGVEDMFNTRDVNFHRRHRRLLGGPFSESSLKIFHPLVERRVDLTMQRIGEEMATRGVADIFKWFLFMATDIIGELTFGESFRMTEAGEKNDYVKTLERASAVFGVRTTFPTLTRLGASGVPIPGFGDSSTVIRGITKYAKESLDRYKSLLEKDPDNPIQTLFTRLFKGEENDTMSYTEIRHDAQLYIVAGSDTTAVSLVYLVWLVCKHPEVHKKLLAELQQLPDDYTDNELVQLPYLNRVITEALRIKGAVPSALPRSVPPGGANLGGYYIPGGTTVCTQAYSLHRNPDVFTDPEKFDPDRWVSPTRDMKDSYMPFGGGSRVCIGIHLARLELRLGTARFFRMYPNAKISTLEGMSDDDMEQQLSFLAPPKTKRCLVEVS
ncbi:hypothetical protein VM1G_08319 [Cytospora mali]|uniref:Sterigmatocystin biosynthesis P450 monooxygenase STCB n=1 Tax=Cytospora mali TaxID=578113 RepID=A0A194W9N8_CYTMA|nr:hypothetical protein VM1G_08319 [Valsa mali]